MDFIEKAIKVVDWFGRFQLVYTTLIGLGVGTALRAILRLYTHVNPLWITPLWLLTTVGVAAFAMWIIRKLGAQKPRIAQITTTPTETAIFGEIDKFHTAHAGQMLQETEDIIKAEAGKYKSGNERETILIRSLATTVLMGFFEVTWHIIFGSQIKALEHLNKVGVAKADDLLPFFKLGLDKRPQYPFESWFGYLKEQVLIRQEGYNVSITVRGKEFLKYLV